ncbi:MAG: GWxTD domain-containing protein [Acidobacteriota bacterium]
MSASNKVHLRAFFLLAFLLCAPAPVWPAGQGSTVAQEESEDYFRKWLEEDVDYIITSEEKSVFKSLTTPEEKERFIEQFWRRRDPDPLTSTNEFKEEHYRRIAYANEKFRSGIAGWRTDRGRIYIIHGPPDEIERHPSGGRYRRPLSEGGGSTLTYPFEMWRYRHIEGLGQNIELEFVDPTWAGEFHLALDPSEKDALLHVPTVGLTLAEELGMADKVERPFFSPGNREHYPLMARRAQDNPFLRYERLANVQRTQEIKYKDLQEAVKVNISFSELPFEARADYFKLNGNQVLVPVTVQMDNMNLAFKEENGLRIARMAIYGLGTTITQRVVSEFEDEVVTAYRPQDFEQGLHGKSIYQKILRLEPSVRCRIDLVIKDIHSGKIGVIRKAIAPPSFAAQTLSTSSLLVTDYLRVLDHAPDGPQMFVLGDVRVRPSIDREFSFGSSIATYLQVYDFAIDPSTGTPWLEVRYRISRGEDLLLELIDERGESVQYFSDERIVLVRKLPVEGLEPGRYRVEVEVRDRIAERTVRAGDDFTFSSPQMSRR